MRGKSLRSCIARKKKKSNYNRRCFNNFALWNLWDSSNSNVCVKRNYENVFLFSFSIYQFKRNLNFSCSEFIKSMYFKLNVWKLVSISERKIDLSNKILTITSCNYCYNSFKNISNYWLVAMKSIQNIYCIFTLFSEASITIKI